MALSAQERLEYEKLMAEKAMVAQAAPSAAVKLKPNRLEMPRRGILETIMAPAVLDISAGDMEGANIDEKLQNAVKGVPEVGNAVVNMGIRGGPPAVGQAVGATTGPLAPVAVPALGALGGMGGEALAQMREGGGFRPGAIIGAGVAGAVPGSPMANIGAKALLKEGAKQVGGNIAATATQAAIDDGRVLSPGDVLISAGTAAAGTAVGKALDKGVKSAAVEMKELQHAVRDQTLREAQAAGYMVSPSKINPSKINNLMESIAGKAATLQEFAIRNQEITNALARKAVKLPANAPLTEAALEKIRYESAAPYREIESIAKQAKADLDVINKKIDLTATNRHEYEVLLSDPQKVREMASLSTRAAANIKELKEARFKANENYTHYHRSGDPAALERARDFEKSARDLEVKVHRAAMDIGRPDLAKQLHESRVKIAKTYEVEKALNLGDANVRAPVLGRSIDKKGVRAITEELALIAKFQQTFPSMAREASLVPAPGVGQLPVYAAAALGAGIAPQAALLPFISQPIRSMVTSPAYQRFMAQPNHGARQMDSLAQFARLTAQSARNPLLEYLEQEYPRNPQAPR
jgi:hypothetical protein